MNNQLIEKIIKSNDPNACPEFTYENPLLDKNIAGALARSFVKILRVSQQDSNINNNLRNSVLANIRKMCRIQPDNHLEVDENFTNSMAELYLNQIKEDKTNSSIDSIESNLDEFLLRKMKEVNLKSNYQTSVNPEVLQALLNLTENKSKLITITNNVLHWNLSDKKCLALVKDLWTNPNLSERSNTNFSDDISLTMKSEIEIILLNVCHSVLTDPNLRIEELITTNNNFRNLVKKCSISAECFQICSRILNYLFINTNYNPDIQILISKFTQYVKEYCSKSISILYPAHLSPIVVLLDINLDNWEHDLKNKYIERTLIYLKTLHEKADTDLVLLLSHFPGWFDIYYDY